MKTAYAKPTVTEFRSKEESLALIDMIAGNRSPNKGHRNFAYKIMNKFFTAEDEDDLNNFISSEIFAYIDNEWCEGEYK